MKRLPYILVVATLALSLYVASSSMQGQSNNPAVQTDLQAYMQARTVPLQGLTRFTFGVYSDLHMTEMDNAVITRAQWQGILRRWRDAGHVFGLIVGDMGYGNAADPGNVLSGPAAVPDAPPVFYAMGNHELEGIGKRTWLDALYPGAVRATSWTAAGGIPAGNSDQAYYSFNVGPATHFIVLDGDYMTFDGQQRYWQSFGQRQLAWLAADLAGNTARNVLVFVHEPIDQQTFGSTPDYTLNDKGGLIDLLAAHPKQAFVFSGHFHSLGGITRWKGITSVHVQTSAPPSYGVTVAVDGDNISVTNAGAVTDFDAHPMNQVQVVGSEQVQRVAEDGADSGRTRNNAMTIVGAEGGASPTLGSLMLKGPATNWYNPRFISEQLIKIRQGMKFSFDIFLYGVVGGLDAVTVQPNWYMKDGSQPPLVVDQNGIALSQRSRDGRWHIYNEDVPRLNGLATQRWYHREFNLSALAGNYVDGVYLTEQASFVNVGAIYVDNIKFSWPIQANVPPTVTLVSPSQGGSFVAPASITLLAAAADTDGSVSRVDFYAGSTLIGGTSSAPFSATWTNVPAGTYVLTAVARDNGGLTTTSAPVAVSVGSAPSGGSSSATFVGNDTTTRGNWKGIYGAQGYMLSADGQSVPSYAAVQQTGATSYTWVGSTADTRALTRTSSTDRIAATWYGGAMSTDLNFVDGLSHMVSLYIVDWESRSWTQTIDAVDPTTGVVLDTRTVNSFSNGQYLSWNLKGRVQLRLRSPSGNGVYSALFFDAASGAAPAPGPAPLPSPGTSAAFVTTDTTTLGLWKGAYGTQGYSLAGDGTNLPGYATVQQGGASSYVWAGSTSDARALTRAASSDRLAAAWYGGVLSTDINLVDGLTHRVSIYTLDWDTSGRVETIEVVDAATGAVLDTRSASSFAGGQYFVWNLKGHVLLRLTRTAGGSYSVYSALFFDPSTTAPAPSGPTAVSFVGTDAATRGTWKGTYGSQGYSIVNDSLALPAYAAVQQSGSGSYTWAGSTADTRALMKGAAGDRIASTWYGNAMTTDINFIDGLTHRVALYLLDWDGNGRAETIEILDSATGSVLDTRQATGFGNGQYLVWSVKGRVQLRITRTAGYNAVASGLFFD